MNYAVYLICAFSAELFLEDRTNYFFIELKVNLSVEVMLSRWSKTCHWSFELNKMY